MKTWKKIALCSMLSLCFFGARPALAAPDAASVSARVQSVLGVKPASVARRPFGLWEVVVTPDQVIYVDDTVRYAVSGHVVDLATMEDLTQARIAELSRIDWKSLPLGDALKSVHGSGRYEVAVFADATCVFCRKLENYFARMDDVTVYTFVFPMKNSREVSRDIVCAKDAPKAWTDLMARGVKPASASCDDSVLERNAELSRRLGVTGTPTLFFPNGERLGGVPSFDDLREVLREGAKHRSAAK